MDDMSTSWNVYDYPDPPEEKEEFDKDGYDSYMEDIAMEHYYEEKYGNGEVENE